MATISLLAMIALCIVATVAIACAIHQRSKRSHGRGRRNSHEELYTNVNAGRGGYDPTRTSTKPAMKKKQSEVGAALAPSGGGGSPFLKKEKSSGGVHMTKLDDSFFSGSSDSIGESSTKSQFGPPAI